MLAQTCGPSELKRGNPTLDLSRFRSCHLETVLAIYVAGYGSNGAAC
jgi:hypothetical protein